jgi:hypothetical protein
VRGGEVINLTGWIYLAGFLVATLLFYLILLWLVLYMDDECR